jgi:hypothetical protein
LFGGKIVDGSRDACRGPEENKVRYTVNGSSICLDRDIAERASKLVPIYDDDLRRCVK